MKVDSIVGLQAAFDDWRSAKKYRRESVPQALVERARAAVGVYGLAKVVKASGLPYSRLRAQSAATTQLPTVVPAYSRVEVVTPQPTNQALLEVHLVSGVKLRAFVLNALTADFVSTLCLTGGRP